MAYVERSWELITAPSVPRKDGIGLADGNHYTVHHCIIDLSNCELATLDEALGITLGSAAYVHHCVIRGAGKLILLGCGDDPDDPKNAEYAIRIRAEYGKHVSFADCLFDGFSRRGPEVQGGMSANMTRCVIRDWGKPERFETRAFGAWAHDGGRISASYCVFDGYGSNEIPLRYKVRDHVSHFFQAYNDRLPFKSRRKPWHYLSALAGFFTRDAYVSGYRRALTAGPGGIVSAHKCYATIPGTIIQNHIDPMNDVEASFVYDNVVAMEATLERRLCWGGK